MSQRRGFSLLRLGLLLVALAAGCAAAAAAAAAGGPRGKKVHQSPDGGELLYGDDPRKPAEVTREVVCHACHAVVREVAKAAPASRRGGKPGATEADVFDAVSKVCDQARLRTYRFVPPTMVAGCHAFLSEHGDGLEEAIMSARRRGGGSEGAGEDAVCAKACRGIEYVDVGEAAERRTAAAAEEKKSRKAPRRKRKAAAPAPEDEEF